MKLTDEDIRSFQATLTKRGEPIGPSIHSYPHELYPILNEAVNWTLGKVKEMFEEEERRGARGYSADRPAKMIENLRKPGKSFRDILLESLDTLYTNTQEKDDDRVKENYKLLRTTLENFPVSSLVR
jgi:hypothetical protein